MSEFGLQHGEDIPWKVWRQFTARLGFGDGVTEPAATLDDLIDPLEDVLAAARDHDECPVWCEVCNQWEISRSCPECHGAGGFCVSGAFAECNLCGGTGTDHLEYRLSGPRDRNELADVIYAAHIQAVRNGSPWMSTVDGTGNVVSHQIADAVLGWIGGAP